MKALTAVLLGIFVVGPLSLIWHGFVITKLWAWYVAPLGIVQIGLPTAVGLLVLMALLTKNVPEEDKEHKDPEEALAKGFMIGITKPAFVLLIGWIFHFFVAV